MCREQILSEDSFADIGKFLAVIFDILNLEHLAVKRCDDDVVIIQNLANLLVRQEVIIVRREKSAVVSESDYCVVCILPNPIQRGDFVDEGIHVADIVAGVIAGITQVG